MADKFENLSELFQIIKFCRIDCENKQCCEKCKFQGLTDCEDYKIALELCKRGYGQNDLKKIQSMAFFRYLKFMEDVIEVVEIPKDIFTMRFALKQCGIEYKGLSEEELKEAYEKNCMGYGFNGF